jgi:RNA polymerase sigma factor (sigma-70 family)
MEMTEPADVALPVEGAPAGDLAGGFEAFFADQSTVLFRRLCLVTGNRSEAEEIMQDAFLKIWERWDRVRSMDDPTAYLYRTAMNQFRKRYRRAAMAIRKVVRPEAVVDEFVASEIRTDVGAALATLSPRQRAALVLVDLLEFSSEDAARMLGVKAATVRSLATQGRASLRRRMQKEDDA